MFKWLMNKLRPREKTAVPITAPWSYSTYLRSGDEVWHHAKAVVYVNRYAGGFVVEDMYCLRRAIGHPHHQVPGNIEIHMRSMMAPLVVFEALLKQLGDFKYPEAQRVLYVEADGSIPYRLDNVILTQLGYSYKDEEAYNGVMITGGNIAAVAATVTACPMDHLPKPPQSAVSSTPTSSPEKDAVSAVENLDDTLD